MSSDSVAPGAPNVPSATHAPETGPGHARGRDRSPDFVQSLERGLSVIRAFGSGRSHLSLSDVARETGLTRAAARRFLLTLVDLGYVRCEGRMFSLRPKVLELGSSYLSTLSFGEAVLPHMEELVATLRASATLTVLDGDEIVAVARVPTSRTVTVAVAAGSRFPAHATAVGRVLLAGLGAGELDAYLDRVRLEPLTPHTVTDRAALRAAIDEARREGHAIVDQELELGLRTVAVPIVDAAGRVLAAINVTVHAERISTATLRDCYLPTLTETGQRISATLRALGVGTGRPRRRRAGAAR